MFKALKRLFSRHRQKPVSEALRVEQGILGRQLLDAVAAVDRVHQDGALPVIPVKWALLLDMHGYFQNTSDGAAVEIVVSLLSPHRELTMLHEIGHFLDYKGLDPSHEWASVSSPALAAWRQAVKGSAAVQRLHHFMQPEVSTVKETFPDGSVVECPISKSYVEYLLKAEELWARSYSQFVALKSGDAEVRHQLDGLRVHPVNGTYYGQQWDDADFQPISEEIENVFRHLRWM